MLHVERSTGVRDEACVAALQGLQAHVVVNAAVGEDKVLPVIDVIEERSRVTERVLELGLKLELDGGEHGWECARGGDDAGERKLRVRNLAHFIVRESLLFHPNA